MIVSIQVFEGLYLYALRSSTPQRGKFPASYSALSPALLKCPCDSLAFRLESQASHLARTKYFLSHPEIAIENELRMKWLT